MKIRQVMAAEKDTTILILYLINQTVYSFIMALFYPILSFMTFGEGSNSFMYTRTNDIIYVLLLVLPTAIYNSVQYSKNVNEKKFGAAKSCLITEACIIIGLISCGVIHNYF